MDNWTSSRRPRQGARHPTRGITMLELIVVMAIFGIVAVIGLPALFNTLRKSQIQGTIQETQSLMRAARLQAIKETGTIGVERQASEGRFVSYRNLGGTGGFDSGTDVILQSAALPQNVEFVAPGAETPVDGFAGNDYVLFESTGSVNASGAFRLGDDRGNYFEIRVEPASTGRVDVRKWENFGGTEKWMSQGQENHSWRWN